MAGRSRLILCLRGKSYRGNRVLCVVPTSAGTQSASLSVMRRWRTLATENALEFPFRGRAGITRLGNRKWPAHPSKSWDERARKLSQWSMGLSVQVMLLDRRLWSAPGLLYTRRFRCKETEPLPRHPQPYRTGPWVSVPGFAAASLGTVLPPCLW